MTRRILSIIIPVYNEEATIAEVLGRVAAADTAGWEKEIIAVDDGSADNSNGKIQNAKVRFRIYNCTLLSHPVNCGKGAAIRTGLAAAGGDAVIIQDADLEYDPADWPRMLEEFEKYGGKAAVYGSRELAPERRGYAHYVWGVRILTGIANLLYGARLTDVYTCYKLFPLDVLRRLPLSARGFEFEAEVTARLLRQNTPIVEVPIRYRPRTFSEGKKIRWRDGLIGLWTLCKCRLA